MHIAQHGDETCAYCDRPAPAVATDHQRRPLCARCAAAYAAATQQRESQALTAGAVRRAIAAMFSSRS